ncbi:hypothetical protein F5Y15DRAFT_426810, partial [Xylariaceae sp. FL0016]
EGINVLLYLITRVTRECCLYKLTRGSLTIVSYRAHERELAMTRAIALSRNCFFCFCFLTRNSSVLVDRYWYQSSLIVPHSTALPISFLHRFAAVFLCCLPHDHHPTILVLNCPPQRYSTTEKNSSPTNDPKQDKMARSWTTEASNELIQAVIDYGGLRKSRGKPFGRITNWNAVEQEMNDIGYTFGYDSLQSQWSRLARGRLLQSLQNKVVPPGTSLQDKLLIAADFP